MVVVIACIMMTEDDDDNDDDDVHFVVARSSKLIMSCIYILLRWYIVTPHGDGELAVIGSHHIFGCHGRMTPYSVNFGYIVFMYE